MKSNICIIGTSNIKHISLISLYTRFFDIKEIPYDIIYLDRYGVDEETTANNVFKYTASTSSGTIGKILMFWRFRRFAVKQLQIGGYQYVITWQTTGAYLFADYLMRKYIKRYVINVRDYVAEQKWPFKGIIKRLINKSLFVTISSPGFRVFLPDYDYIRVNSINEDLLSGVLPALHRRDGIVRVGFAGNCRYYNESYKLMDALGNDSRFELWYCGTHSETLEQYAALKGYTNVVIRPGFNPSETIGIMSNFDIVNSAFGNDARDNSTLIPIRLYTAIALHKPMLVNQFTQLAKEVSENGLGYVIEDYHDLGDYLYSYYSDLDFDLLDFKCDRYLEQSRAENQMFYDQLEKLIK